MLRIYTPIVLVITCFMCLYTQYAMAQWTVTGVVRDSLSKDILPYTSIRVNNVQAITDVNGAFTIQTDKQDIEMDAFHVGYRKYHYSYKDKTNINKNLVFYYQILLKPLANDINAVVISGSKYGKTIAEEVVSMSTVNTNYVTTRNLDASDKLINKIPGVTIMDGQPQIRGGSGYAYGAGSRVQVLYDDMPLISADAGDVKWDMLPMESTGRIEVLKGAGSVLYGSGAINGVINFRPAIPTDTAHAQLAIWQGKYGDPRNEIFKWWGGKKWIDAPYYREGTFNWLQKIGKVDVNAGLMAFKEESYREGEIYNRLRSNLKLTWHVNKRLKLGLGTIAMHNNNTTFFIWQDDSAGAYKPLGGTSAPASTLSHIITTRYTIDPSADYFAANGDKHTLRLRLFHNDNNAVDEIGQSAKANMYYAQYQYQHTFLKRLILTTGATYTYNSVNSALYKNHFSRNPALFAQLEYKYKKLTLQGGVRAESFVIDTVNYKLNPVFRAGANYNAWNGGFVRASIGQGFRYPTIAEKFTETSLGSINVYPNPAVQPEHGYTGEVGIAQFFTKGKTNGMMDVAAFDMEMRDFIDFTYGVFKIGHKYTSGFKAVNIEDASIKGIELTSVIHTKVGKTVWHITGGVTFINPINNKMKHVVDSVLSHTSNFRSGEKDSISNLKYLTYRNKVTAKISLAIDYRKCGFFSDVSYLSNIINIDQALEVLPGVADFRATHDKGFWLCDIGVTYNFTKHFNMSAIVRNMFNSEYSYRPALLEEPINYTLKATYQF